MKGSIKKKFYSKKKEHQTKTTEALKDQGKLDGQATLSCSYSSHGSRLWNSLRPTYIQCQLSGLLYYYFLEGSLSYCTQSRKNKREQGTKQTKLYLYNQASLCPLHVQISWTRGLEVSKDNIGRVTKRQEMITTFTTY